MWDDEGSSWPNHAVSRFVEAAGIRWHVQMMGAGEPLLLVHGTGASTHSWRDVMPILAKEFKVLAFDLPGHGFTTPAPGRTSIEGMSHAIAALLAALEFQPAYCAGHSAGSVILCRMALDRWIDSRVIIAINGAFMPLRGAASLVFSPLAKLLARSTHVPRLLARRAANPASVARLLEGTGSKLDGVGVELYARLVRNPSHLAGALGMMGSWDLHAFARDLPRLRTPLALLAGQNDRTVPPRQAEEVRRLVPHCTLSVFPGLGHLAHEEQPRLVAERIIAICRDHAGAGPGRPVTAAASE